MNGPNEMRISRLTLSPSFSHTFFTSRFLPSRMANSEPRIVALNPLERRLDRTVSDPLDGDPFLEPCQRCRIDGTEGADPVAPEPAGGRKLELAGKLAVIGQQQQAFAVEVEAPDRDDARHLLGQPVEDGRPPPRVAVGDEQSGRLVIAPQPRPLGLWQRPAVDQHVVLRTDIDRRRGQDGAIEAHPALGNEPLGIAARAQPGPRHDLGDAVSRKGCWRRRAADHRLGVAQKHRGVKSAIEAA